MLLLILSGLFSILFGTLFVFILNYIIYQWESQTINKLVSKAKVEVTESILNKNTTSRAFTASFASFDKNLGQNIVKSLVKNYSLVLSGNKNRDLVSNQTGTEDEGGWQLKLRLLYKKAVRWWMRFRFQLVKFFSPVFNSDKYNQVEIIAKKKKPQDTQSDLNKDVSAVINSDVEQETNPSSNLLKAHLPPTSVNSNQYEEDEVLSIVDKPNNNATLNLLNQGQEKSHTDLTLFEKLEQKLIDSLKNEGLNHYDIWLDLGQLYQKYEQNEKAKEVYALVLKNADGLTKEKAKNFLVGLS